MITIDEQVRAMATELPEWRCERSDRGTAVWIGTLMPHRTSYTIRIEYTEPLLVACWSLLLIQPLVEVLTPPLRWLFWNAEGPLPHVYFAHPRSKRPGPFLCLFDDARQEWTPDDRISDTTVPWAANWLSCYESWLVTGRWFGTGKHVVRATTREAELTETRRQLYGSTADAPIAWDAVPAT